MKKKNINIFGFIIILTLIIVPIKVEATQVTQATSSTAKMRTGPSTTCDRVIVSDGTKGVSTGTVTILKTVGEKPVNTDCSSNLWYYVSTPDSTASGTYNAYICSDNVSNVRTVEISDSDTTSTTSTAIATNYNVVAYGIYNGERVPVIQKKSGTDSTGCTEYKVLVDNNKIVCAPYTSVTDVKNVSVLNTNNISYNYNTELAKFPTDYQNLIAQIHAKHPSWRFYAVNTGLDFNEAVKAEMKGAYIQYVDSNSTTNFDTYEAVNYDWRTNKWDPKESSTWFSVSKTAAAFYLDPRNYLTINSILGGGTDYQKIFAFEDGRAYTYQENGNLDKMIEYARVSNVSITDANGTSFTYKQAFTDGATFSKTNAAMLIARSRNETTFTSNSVTGTYTSDKVLGNGTGLYKGISLDGYYNYFNVGAYADSAKGEYPTAEGLLYAKNAGWNNRYSSIVEGSTFVGTKYIYNNQETQYFQKFNVNPASMYGAYNHQYQTNIQVLNTEGGFAFWGYKDSGNIDLPIVFYIPVYNNMPSTISVEPKDGNPNNWLTNLTIDGSTVSGFDGDKYYSYDDNYDGKNDGIYENNIYKYTLAWNKSSINIGTTTAVSTSSVSGNGNVSITNKTTEVNVVVTAQNGTTKTYKIIVTKEDAPELDEDGNPIYPAINDILNASGVKYNDSGNYMMGLYYGTTRDALANKLSSVSSLVKVTVTKNSSNITNNLATGDTIKIVSGSNTKTYTYILYGDSNGDGYIYLSDLVDCRNYILKTSNLTALGRKALDINKSGEPDITDLVNIRNSILKTGTIQQ